MEKTEFIKKMETIGAEKFSTSHENLMYDISCDIEKYMENDADFQGDKKSFYSFYSNMSNPYIGITFEFHEDVQSPSVTYCVTDGNIAGDNIEDDFNGVLELF